MADSGRSYEEQRERNIEQNRRYLADLGLAAVPAAPVFGDGGTRRVHRKGGGGGGGAIRTIRDVTPVKKSRRLLGEKAPDFHKVRVVGRAMGRARWRGSIVALPLSSSPSSLTPCPRRPHRSPVSLSLTAVVVAGLNAQLDVEDAVTLARTGQLQVDDPDQEAPVPQAVYKRSKREDPDSDAPVSGRAAAHPPRPTPRAAAHICTNRPQLPAEAYAPLSLLSVSTTILDLGRLVTGPDKYLYWSNRGVRFRGWRRPPRTLRNADGSRASARALPRPPARPVHVQAPVPGRV